MGMQLLIHAWTPGAQIALDKTVPVWLATKGKNELIEY